MGGLRAVALRRGRGEHGDGTCSVATRHLPPRQRRARRGSVGADPVLLDGEIDGVMELGIEPLILLARYARLVLKAVAVPRSVSRRVTGGCAPGDRRFACKEPVL